MIRSEEKQVLAVLQKIITSLELPMLLVGAGARLLIFDQKFDTFGQGRSTKDWDVAISIDSWEAYQEFRELLVNVDAACFQATKAAHKFIHIATNIEVDIIPFGAISEPDQEITWPDSDSPMNVLGFAEALAHAKAIPIDDWEIQVVDTPALIALKVFAWGDRGTRTNKDLEDIEFILKHYEDFDRAYEELRNQIISGELEFKDAHAYLLGQDIGRILQPKTLIALNRLLDKLIKRLDLEESAAFCHHLQVLQQGIYAVSRSAEQL